MSPETKELYGEDIRRIGMMLGDQRRALDVTQVELAQRICRTQSRVSDVETGAADHRLSSLIRYADGLGCNLVIKLVPWSSTPG